MPGFLIAESSALLRLLKMIWRLFLLKFLKKSLPILLFTKSGGCCSTSVLQQPLFPAPAKTKVATCSFFRDPTLLPPVRSTTSFDSHFRLPSARYSADCYRIYPSYMFAQGSVHLCVHYAGQTWFFQGNVSPFPS